ncbi:MAG: Glu/Leu/Phe/Val dehydrogenase dimerization domain-containing protein [Candidatus Micrarchaeota archaeon]
MQNDSVRIRNEVMLYWKKPPLKVIEWNDRFSDAKGWLVVNNKVNGAAGGGIRMHPDLTKDEVVRLAKSMCLKFKLLNPQIGGAKAGIRHDPAKPDKLEILERFLHHIKPLLLTEYGTGGDLNVSEPELIKLLKKEGIPHPQYGIVQGVKNSGVKLGSSHALKRLQKGVMLPYAGSPLVNHSTGKGVVAAIRVGLRFLSNAEAGFKGKTAAVQGFGVVGGGTAKFFHEAGGKVVAISDKACCIHDPEGLDVPTLLSNRINGREINLQELPEGCAALPREKLLSSNSDVFIPAAKSDLVNEKNAHLIRSRLIVEGANNPITPAADGILHDKGITVVPDFIANAGTAALFHLCMFRNMPLKASPLLQEIDRIVGSHTRNFLKEFPQNAGYNSRIAAEAHALRIH